MYYKIYQVDSFSDDIYRGNPACVIPLNEWLDDEIMLKIAKENAVAETAFFIKNEKEIYLRWFTPDLEMDLCGHATLATAYILRSILKYSLDELTFNTLSGKLTVSFYDDIYYLDLPSRKPKRVLLPKKISNSLNILPQEVFRSRDYMLIYKSEQEVHDIIVNKKLFDKINLGYGGVIVTAIGEDVDFVSRYFTPQATILEDPVTGSAHCSLVPFWSSILFKKDLEALQISKRGGRLFCKNNSNRVIVGGKANLSSVREFFYK